MDLSNVLLTQYTPPISYNQHLWHIVRTPGHAVALKVEQL